jgi:hypothetical protein
MNETVIVVPPGVRDLESAPVGTLETRYVAYDDGKVERVVFRRAKLSWVRDEQKRDPWRRRPRLYSTHAVARYARTPRGALEQEIERQRNEEKRVESELLRRRATLQRLQAALDEELRASTKP